MRAKIVSSLLPVMMSLRMAASVIAVPLVTAARLLISTELCSPLSTVWPSGLARPILETVFSSIQPLPTD